MRSRWRATWWSVCLIAIFMGRPSSCCGQTTSPTLWSFLGIGADQNSANPAIKAAAKAKAAKHQICKKKKALQYLAGMGCTREHPEVAPALIAAMGDPDEPVRYEAVKAVLQTAAECQGREQKRETRKAIGCWETCHDLKKKIEKKICDCIDRLFGKAPPKEHKCKKKLEECCDKMKQCLTGKEPCVDPSKEECPCGNGDGPCCGPEMREKLQQLAYGRDEQGCFLEKSERVRTVAEQALKACQACGQGQAMGLNANVVRELPVVDDRELPDWNAFHDGDACQTDRAVIAVPDAVPPASPLPAPEPLTIPPPGPAPVVEELPPSASVHRLPSVLVRSSLDHRRGRPDEVDDRLWRERDERWSWNVVPQARPASGPVAQPLPPLPRPSLAPKESPLPGPVRPPRWAHAPLPPVSSGVPSAGLGRRQGDVPVGRSVLQGGAMADRLGATGAAAAARTAAVSEAANGSMPLASADRDADLEHGMHPPPKSIVAPATRAGDGSGEVRKGAASGTSHRSDTTGLPRKPQSSPVLRWLAVFVTLIVVWLACDGFQRSPVVGPRSHARPMQDDSAGSEPALTASWWRGVAKAFACCGSRRRQARRTFGRHPVSGAGKRGRLQRRVA
jgi:hypothetical protein